MRDSSPAARPATSPTGTSSPFLPWLTISRQPGTSVATMGRPEAAASINDFGSPSRYEGRQAIWQAERTSGISARWPHHSTKPERCHSRSLSWVIDVGLPGSTSPTKAKRAERPLVRKACAACTNSPTPLSHNMRDTRTTIGIPEGSGQG
jgi:hypothetical protein